MDRIKLTVRVRADALEAAERYAREHGTSVTNLVEALFESLGRADALPQETPILKELAGSLGVDASLEDYRLYLEKKYLGDSTADR
mgnify:CR=1 FL=1|jgi:hypothetical protein